MKNDRLGPEFSPSGLWYNFFDREKPIDPDIFHGDPQAIVKEWWRDELYTMRSREES